MYFRRHSILGQCIIALVLIVTIYFHHDRLLKISHPSLVITNDAETSLAAVTPPAATPPDVILPEISPTNTASSHTTRPDATPAVTPPDVILPDVTAPEG
jgi:hypothetical protein